MIKTTITAFSFNSILHQVMLKRVQWVNVRWLMEQLMMTFCMLKAWNFHLRNRTKTCSACKTRLLYRNSKWCKAQLLRDWKLHLTWTIWKKSSLRRFRNTEKTTTIKNLQTTRHTTKMRKYATTKTFLFWNRENSCLLPESRNTKISQMHRWKRYITTSKNLAIY